MRLSDYIEAHRTVKNLLRVTVDPATRQGLVKLDLIMENLIQFRSQVTNLAGVQMEDVEFFRTFITSLFID